MRVLRTLARPALLLAGLVLLSPYALTGQLDVRFERKPDGQLSTASSDTDGNGICSLKAFSPRLEFLWRGDTQSLRRGYGKPASWYLVRFTYTVDGVPMQCSNPGGVCLTDVSGSSSGEIEDGVLLLNRYSPVIKKDDHPRAFTTGQHTLSFSAPSLNIGATTTYSLQCGGDAPPPEPPPGPEVVEPTVPPGLYPEMSPSGEAWRGIVADGRSRLKLHVVVPDNRDGPIREVRVRAKYGKFTDADGSPVEWLEPNGPVRYDSIYYVPPEYVYDAGGLTEWLVVDDTSGDTPGVRGLKEVLRLTYRVDNRPDEVDLPLDVFRPPVVLVHGFLGAASTWNSLATYLNDRGWDTQADDYYSPGEFGLEDVRAQSDLLHSVVQLLRLRYARAGILGTRVNVVAHSMGGLIARDYVRGNPKYDGAVRKIIMLATPNHGIDWWIDNKLGEWGSALIDTHIGMKEDVHHESAFIERINRGENVGAHLDPDVQYGNIYRMKGDWVVRGASARLKGVAELVADSWVIHSSDIPLPGEGITDWGPAHAQVEEWLQQDIPAGTYDALRATVRTTGRVLLNRPNANTETLEETEVAISNGDQIRAESGHTLVRYDLGTAILAVVSVEPGTEIHIGPMHPRSLILTMVEGKAVYRSFETPGQPHASMDLVVTGGSRDPMDWELPTGAKLETFGTEFAVEAGQGAYRVDVLSGGLTVSTHEPRSEPDTVLRGQAVFVRQGRRSTPPPVANRWWEESIRWGESLMDADRPVAVQPPARPTTPPTPPPSGGATTTEAYVLDAYPADFNSLAGRITNRANAGFTPVGLAVYGGQVHVLYLGGSVMPISGWQMDTYRTAQELQQGISGRMEAGYLPNGLAWSDGRYFVLYVMTDFTGTAWQIVTSDVNLDAVRKDLEPWLRQDYVPFDVTLADGRYLTLLVQLPEKLSGTWSIEGTYPNGLNALIQRQLGAGFVPWGLLVDEVANVLFLGS